LSSSGLKSSMVECRGAWYPRVGLSMLLCGASRVNNSHASRCLWFCGEVYVLHHAQAESLLEDVSRASVRLGARTLSRNAAHARGDVLNRCVARRRVVRWASSEGHQPDIP